MEMRQDGVKIDCLPDETRCKADKEKRSPLNIDVCPCGHEICTGDCIYYTE